VPDLQIVCKREGGMNRGGIRHPEGRKAHAMDKLTPDQLREMLAEPALELIIGEPLTEKHVAALEKASGKEKPAS
jgi:hypothetical protein